MTFVPASLRQVKIAHMQALLARYHTLAEVAKVLGIEESTLWRWRKAEPEPVGIPAGVWVGGYDGWFVRIGGAHSLAVLEAAHIGAMLGAMSPSEAVRALQIERSTLMVKRRKYGLKAPRKRRTVDLGLAEL